MVATELSLTDAWLFGYCFYVQMIIHRYACTYTYIYTRTCTACMERPRGPTKDEDRNRDGDRQTDRQISSQTDRYMEIHIHTYTYMPEYIFNVRFYISYVLAAHFSYVCDCGVFAFFICRRSRWAGSSLIRMLLLKASGPG